MKDIKLFDYQEEMVRRVQEAFGRCQAVMVQMPTGTGKTMLLAAVVSLFLDKDVWIVAHRRELVSQIQETTERLFSFLTTKQRSTDEVKANLTNKTKQRSAAEGNYKSAAEGKVKANLSGVKVVSIQWLSRHYNEMTGEPGLIVVDEAHHALAETYSEVLNAFPRAKKLGLTATPYRLNGCGFTDLFDTLLCSWSMERFIAEGRLSLYDYFSIRQDSEEQMRIDSLRKRGADGDYQLKEMCEVMDVRPSLSRLCRTVKEYVPGKKGIVYAISIRHAEHIAEFYREHGIAAMAISSKTPNKERRIFIERFKNTNNIKSPTVCTENTDFLNTKQRSAAEGKVNLPNQTNLSSLENNGPIQVLVSVDLFSEGFDCPDVEFIQLARPTLSLTKYMQMVGRGLRVAEGKEYCVILDNVGMYRRFGLPSMDRDWESMFRGTNALEDVMQETCMHVYRHSCRRDGVMDDGDEEMMRVVNHEWQLRYVSEAVGFCVFENEKGLKGVKDRDGNVVVDCLYKKLEVTTDGFAYCYIRKKAGRKEWVDLRNGLWFAKKPHSVRLLGIDFCTEDGKRLYPRIRSKFIDEKAWLTVKTLELQVGSGLSWKKRFIPWDEPNRVYYYKEGVCDLRLYVDDDDKLMAQENMGSPLTVVPSEECKDELCREAKVRYNKERWERQDMERKALHLVMFNAYLAKEGVPEGDDIVYVKNFEFNKKEVWVDTLTKKIYFSKPTTFKRGFVGIVQVGDWCYIRNIPGLLDTPFRQWQIRADENICVIDNKYLFVKKELQQWYKIYKRTDDFSFFVVKRYEGYGKMDNKEEIQITQFEGEGLRMTMNGMPYKPFVYSRNSPNWYWE